MKLFFSKCKRFAYLLNESEDRALAGDEASFLEDHRATCPRCDRLSKSGSGLNMMRTMAMTGEPSSGFDDRLMRRFRLANARASFSYWLPALMGGAVAGLALLAALQMISQPDQLPVFRGDGEARRVSSNPFFPALQLKRDTDRVP